MQVDQFETNPKGHAAVARTERALNGAAQTKGGGQERIGFMHSQAATAQTALKVEGAVYGSRA